MSELSPNDLALRRTQSDDGFPPEMFKTSKPEAVQCYVNVTSYSLGSCATTAASAQDGVTQDVGELEQGEDRDAEEQGRDPAEISQERQPLQRRDRGA